MKGYTESVQIYEKMKHSDSYFGVKKLREFLKEIQIQNKCD